MDQKLINKIERRREEGTLRSLSHFEEYIDFFSNDYLGMAKESFKNDVGILGGTGSRLISGTTKSILLSEQLLADFFSAEAGLMFNSGYDANIGFFSCVPQRGDTVLYDEYIHASVRDGLRMGFAKGISFKHNDLQDLQEKLEKSVGVIYVAVESLYSMDGDLSPLRGIADLCKKYKAYLVVDEAHAAGVFGEDGRGLVGALNMEKDVFARLVTFGKAYGSHGGCVLGGKRLVEYLTNFARSFIYTTALPVAVYLRNAYVVKSSLIQERKEKLQQILEFFRTSYTSQLLISEVNSPIQILQVGDVDKTRGIAQRLHQLNIAVKPIYSPTVPIGKERLRLCFHSFNTKKDVDILLKGLDI